MSRGRLRAVLCLGAVVASACGGGGGGPTAPPAVGPTHAVDVAVYYDENANGALDSSEFVRIPDATVEVAGRQGRSAAVTGQVMVDNVPDGAQMVSLRAASLPPFFVAPAPIPIVVPQSQTAFIPVTLPIGSNRPNVYLAFGDSITDGEGSADGNGYVSRLQRKLEGHFGRATMIKDGLSATRSNRGSDRLPDSLTVRAAYTLILYGTNDWNVGECKTSPPCFTIDSLRTMVRDVKFRQGIPVLATIIPANPTFELGPTRNQWISAMDARIREMARAEGAVVADLEAAFLRDAQLSRLYTDHIHPNDAGYELMAQAFFEAISRPAPAAAAAGPAIPFPSVKPSHAPKARPSAPARARQAG
jgi:lysophospholipase L1-like esterase